MPQLDPDLVSALAIAGASLGVLCLLLSVFAQLRLRRLRRALTELRASGRGGPGRSHEVAGALRQVAVVRYDAFGDMGGRLSFSAALLDEAGDGLVLTSINGRTETRTYAKGISAGKGEQTLSPEEQEAISAAMRGARGPAGLRR